MTKEIRISLDLNKITCPITGLVFKKPVVTNCSHTFEEEGLMTNIKEYKKNTCPLCRTEITTTCRNRTMKHLVDQAIKECPELVDEQYKTKLNNEQIIRYIKTGRIEKVIVHFTNNRHEINNPIDKYNSTPLHHMAWRNRLRGTKKLLSLGADPNLFDTYDCTAVYWAVQKYKGDGNIELIKTLLPKSHLTTARNRTLLHFASKYSKNLDESVCKLIVEDRPSIIGARDSNGKTVADIANEPIKKYLVFKQAEYFWERHFLSNPTDYHSSSKDKTSAVSTFFDYIYSLNKGQRIKCFSEFMNFISEKFSNNKKLTKDIALKTYLLH